MTKTPHFVITTKLALLFAFTRTSVADNYQHACECKAASYSATSNQFVACTPGGIIDWSLSLTLSVTCPLSWTPAEGSITASSVITAQYTDQGGDLNCDAVGVDQYNNTYATATKHSCATPGGCTSPTSYTSSTNNTLTIPLLGTTTWIGFTLNCDLPTNTSLAAYSTAF